MDKKHAVLTYQYGERSKSELMIASQLITVLSGLKDDEQKGGRKIVIQSLESVRMDLQFALRDSSLQEFQRAIDALNAAISLVESNDCDGAVRYIGSAISAVTTVAQHAWTELEKNGYL
jgi:hypothetical protein